MSLAGAAREAGGWLHSQHVFDTPENQAEYPQPPGAKAGNWFSVGVLRDPALAGHRHDGRSGNRTVFRKRDRRDGPVAKTAGTAGIRRHRVGRPLLLLLFHDWPAERTGCGLCRAVASMSRDRFFAAANGGEQAITSSRGLAPPQPTWMDDETYARMPESIAAREVHVHVKQPGFRTDSFVVVTTLTDAETYTAEEIGELFRKRWLVELDIRALEVHAGDGRVACCQTPEMVRKEIWAALLAYNLIRQTMLQAALTGRPLAARLELDPCAANGCRVVDDRGPVVSRSSGNAHRCCSGKGFVDRLSDDVRDRIEPRAIKRRPKPHDLLTKPRAESQRDELLKSRFLSSHRPDSGASPGAQRPMTTQIRRPPCRHGSGACASVKKRRECRPPAKPGGPPASLLAPAPPVAPAAATSRPASGSAIRS